MVRLYTNNGHDVEVLIDALKLKKRLASSTYEKAVCDKLIARVEKCVELQRPNYGKTKGGRRHDRG